MDWDELLDPLSPFNRETMQEQIKIVNVQDGLIAAAKKLAAENYPAVGNMQPGTRSVLETVIIKHAVKMAVDMHDAITGNSTE
ncbi:hypothetical protein [Chitinophaga solisilvae]|uniref:Uncharacterized protein n=1 Tax=Chitinophaga solisilvae TaxID=1233460 RepID=A0A9Q5DD35_9BACT|nr:hypothetical protein [Chitinophaga solisilvae]NSL88725.1 hypothetical protein [Chitinophaga solisilvae]